MVGVYYQTITPANINNVRNINSPTCVQYGAGPPSVKLVKQGNNNDLNSTLSPHFEKFLIVNQLSFGTATLYNEIQQHTII